MHIRQRVNVDHLLILIPNYRIEQSLGQCRAFGQHCLFLVLDLYPGEHGECLCSSPANGKRKDDLSFLLSDLGSTIQINYFA